ncbi:putative regulatory protein, FmdB family [Thermomonospora echinospora]|uniref:Putative regulatory protein, FmdB family n=1 Tax=Thermomonospora echinospora TaxID=1992 RepID=A0A1H6E5G9_9ACTN|nr:FmdB family zinc ribbon protein [Thermomonospora echinospora]SEG92135.1 putative regulatory protein, FmdB family [Thermomonospora echinospora]
MPTYQYVCTECGEPLEVVQKFSDDALTECPACSGRLRKVFSAAGIIFKGSGFYRTDSRGGGKSSVGSTTSSNGSSDKSADTKSESATKSDSSSGGSTAAASSSSGSGSDSKVA